LRIPTFRDGFADDPRTFLEELHPPVLFDEIQNAPELPKLCPHVDRFGTATNAAVAVTGSQEAPLMRGITESMAGRAAILQLLPFSLTESAKVNMLHGGFPEVPPARSSVRCGSPPTSRLTWKRDVRAITNIRDLVTFSSLSGVASQSARPNLNKTDLAAPLGVSVPTISEVVAYLEVTGQIIVVPPYYENFGKRLIKSPKIYWGDSGLAVTFWE